MSRPSGLAFLALVVAAQVVFFRTAWIGDDAMITLRSVLNVVHGFGPVHNLGERAQAFTHTSWFGLIALGTWIAGNPFSVLFGLSFLINALTFAVLAVLLRQTAWIAVAMLLASKAFVDFANSGLENPLSCLLIALVALGLEKPDGRGKWALLGLLCSALILTRPDLGLMLITLILLHWRARSFLWVILGLVPLFLWEVFSLYYFGSLIPNSALAKLNTGIPKIENLLQGAVYIGDLIITDPFSAALIGFFLWHSIRLRVLHTLTLFAALYLVYTVYIGGDFMSGRFFSVPLFCAVLGIGLMLRGTELPRRDQAVLLGIAVCLVPFNVYDNVLAGRDFGPRSFWLEGIADERGFYFEEAGLITAGLTGFPDVTDWAERAAQAEPPQDKCGGLGLFGLQVGPGVHVIDTCALTDPLLARLPMVQNGFLKWRPGHFYRALPEGYVDLVAGKAGKLSDPGLEQLRQDVSLVTQAPLDAPGRLAAIWRLHVKDYGIGASLSE